MKIQVNDDYRILFGNWNKYNSIILEYILLEWCIASDNENNALAIMNFDNYIAPLKIKRVQYWHKKRIPDHARYTVTQSNKNKVTESRARNKNELNAKVTLQLVWKWKDESWWL